MLSKSFYVLLLAMLLSTATYAKESTPVEAEATKPEFLATINNDYRIPLEEFLVELQSGARGKFFHGKAPEDEVKAFRREVAQKLIDRSLVIIEARRQGLKPNQAEINKKYKEFVEKRKNDPFFKDNKEKIVAVFRERSEGDDLYSQMEEKVKKLSTPADSVVREYYKKNVSLFTTPEQMKVSVIMLKVDPASPSETWQAAMDEAADLVKRIRKGADFAELARIHSGDESAKKGGDMGYLHKGMLAKPAQDVLDMLKPGELSEPVVMLQGVAVLRLEDIKKAVVNPYDVVQKRASELFQREEQVRVWDSFIENLRKTNKIVINESVL